MKCIVPCRKGVLSTILLVTLMLAWGCSDDIYEKKEQNSRHISFQPWEITQTRGVALGSPKALVDNNVSISVNALKYSGDWASLGSTPDRYMSNITLTGDALGANWSYTDTKEWPMEHNLAFFATTKNGAEFVPATTAPFNPSYRITAGEDVMIALPVYNRTYYNAPGSDNAVELNMRHVLAKVGFSVALSSSYTSVSGKDVIIKQIQLGGVEELYSKATCTYNNAQWEFSDLSEVYTGAIGFATSENALSITPLDVCAPGEYHFFIPQDINKNLTVYVDYAIVNSADKTDVSSSGTLSVEFNPFVKNEDKDWEPGEAYNYNIILNPLTGGLDINSGVSNYSMAAKIATIDAHQWEQPLPISAPFGWARVTIQGSPNWARFSGHIARTQTDEDIPEDERYSQDGNWTYYVNFGNNPETSLIRTLLIHFDENVSYTNDKFSDRNFIVDIEYFDELNKDLATIKDKAPKDTPDKSFTCLQTKPFYVGKYGSYNAANYAYTKGLIMENLEECDMEIYYSDRDHMLANKKKIGSNPEDYYWGLKWWESSPKPYTEADYSEYEGKTNTTKITGIDVGASTVSFDPIDRFNTNAANYCQKKGAGWFLPSPVQLGYMMAATLNVVTGSDEYHWALENGSYWTSAAASGTTAKSTTKSGSTRTVDTPFAIVDYKRIRCAKEVDLVILTPPAIVIDGDNVSVDTGGAVIQLDVFNSTKQYNFSNMPTPPCAAGWRLATADELVFLYSVNTFIPTANKMGDYIYWVASKDGGSRLGVKFENGVFIPGNYTTGSDKGYYRCVK